MAVAALACIASSGGAALCVPGAAAEIATLKLIVRDRASGKTVPARVYLTNSAGGQWAPQGAITYEKGKESHFITPGESRIELPADRYRMVIEKGLEFRPVALALELGAGRVVEKTVEMSRWIHMNHLGWYSGDLHNHRRVEHMHQLLLAEELNLAPTITDWIWEDKPVSTPPQTLSPVVRVDETHAYSVLDKEVERLQQGPGAVDLLGLRKAIPFTGYWLGPPNDVFCRLAREQGGWVDAEKIVWRDICALAALGHIDFAGIVHNHFNRHGVELETDAWGMIPKERPEFATAAGMPLWSMEVYYRFLNCGFRIPVSAGSASGVKDSPLGHNRVYVKMDQPFEYDSWFRALKSGHSFATNGPVLFLEANGKAPGHSLQFSGVHAAKIRVRAESSSPRAQDRLEILFKGRVIKTIGGAEPGGRLTADFEFAAEETGWIAARSFERAGETIRFAHTSPIYVGIAGRPGVVPEDARFFLKWIDREMEYYRKESRFRSEQDRLAMLSLFERARAVYEKMAFP
jgi:hypothetical protein